MIKILVTTVILINKNNRVLMEKRSTNNTMQNLWQFPGGKVESNELLKKAAVREIKEELGVIIDDNSLVPLSFEDYTNNDNHFIIFYFVCQNWQGTETSQENQLLKWFSLEEIKIDEIIPYNYKVLQQLVKFLEK